MFSIFQKIIFLLRALFYRLLIPGGGGAVVTRDIPPYSVAVGVPAKVVRTRTKENV